MLVSATGELAFSTGHELHFGTTASGSDTGHWMDIVLKSKSNFCSRLFLMILRNRKR